MANLVRSVAFTLYRGLTAKEPKRVTTTVKIDKSRVNRTSVSSNYRELNDIDVVLNNLMSGTSNLEDANTVLNLETALRVIFKARDLSVLMVSSNYAEIATITDKVSLEVVNLGDNRLTFLVGNDSVIKAEELVDAVKKII